MNLFEYQKKLEGNAGFKVAKYKVALIYGQSLITILDKE